MLGGVGPVDDRHSRGGADQRTADALHVLGTDVIVFWPHIDAPPGQLGQGAGARGPAGSGDGADGLDAGREQRLCCLLALDQDHGGRTVPAPARSRRTAGHRRWIPHRAQACRPAAPTTCACRPVRPAGSGWPRAPRLPRESGSAWLAVLDRPARGWTGCSSPLSRPQALAGGSIRGHHASASRATPAIASRAARYRAAASAVTSRCASRLEMRWGVTAKTRAISV